MSDRHDLGLLSRSLASVEAFKGLSEEEIEELGATLELRFVPRGELLVRQGEQADTLFLVLSGRFRVYRDDRAEAFAEIGSGRPIGEIAFFAGGVRTASVRAERDSLVLKLERDDFEDLAKRSPAIWPSITATLARRLADSSAGSALRKEPRPRTIAVCQAGPQPVPDVFLAKLRQVFGHRSEFVDASTLSEASHSALLLDSPEATSWFNELETRFDHVFYLADAELTPWSEKAIRQADLVLAVGVHAAGLCGSGPELHPTERLAYKLHRAQNLRLVLLHDSRGAITGTRAWLDRRPLIRMHHHLVASELGDYRRLQRFISGTAIGLVACGGGAYSAAHGGLYQALCDAGFVFDMMGGTSGGGAMTAAFASGASVEEIDRHIHEIFVRNKALRRWTWPRYGLLDHTVFDRALEAHFSSVDIEDLWTPYFAVSTNLSSNETYHHRRGPLWEAVRATSAIPALLPPFFTSNGEMLVDGSLLDNVPVAAMRSFKRGPNVVISFQVPGLKRFDVDYRALPSRSQLIWRALNPIRRRHLPAAPGPLAVLLRSLMVARQDFENAVDDGDLLLIPPLRRDLSPLDWQHHSRLKQQAYSFGVSELARLKAMGHPLLQDAGCRGCLPVPDAEPR